MPTAKKNVVNVVRDTELENIVGNLLIAQYQVAKLRARLYEKTRGYGKAAGQQGSTFMFKVGDAYMKFDLSAEVMEAIPQNATGIELDTSD